MEFRVNELAEAAGVGIDTIRFYQARGLLAPPDRRGRFAIYGAGHLDRLRQIRALLEAGFSLAQIRKLVVSNADKGAEGEPDARSGGGSQDTGAPHPTAHPRATRATPDSLLASLAAQSLGGGTLSQRELAAETGVPEALVAAAVRAGLLSPIEVAGEPRFPRSDLDMVAAALAILGEGLPLEPLLALSAQHAAAIAQLAEQAIDLFDDHVRKPRAGDETAASRAFERLLPQATRIVALHFQRTVVARALSRLREKGEAGALEETLAFARDRRLEVQWR